MPNAMRSFDPRRVGRLECTAWVAYYRREWWAFLRAAVGLTGHTFGLPWPATLRGAWHVMRANQLWAPYPDNDPDGAGAACGRFYAPRARATRGDLRRREAARLEVEWWRVHRYLAADAPGEARGRAGRRPRRAVRPRLWRARPRAPGRGAAGARHANSDRWVQEGCDLTARSCSRNARRWCAPTRRYSPQCTGAERSSPATSVRI